MNIFNSSCFFFVCFCFFFRVITFGSWLIPLLFFLLQTALLYCSQSVSPCLPHHSTVMCFLPHWSNDPHHSYFKCLNGLLCYVFTHPTPKNKKNNKNKWINFSLFILSNYFHRIVHFGHLNPQSHAHSSTLSYSCRPCWQHTLYFFHLTPPVYYNGY